MQGLRDFVEKKTLASLIDQHKKIRRMLWYCFGLLTWEHADTIQAMIFAVLYKLLFGAALYWLYYPISYDINDVSQQLFNNTRALNEKILAQFDIILNVQEYRILVLLIVIAVFLVLLGISYWVIIWDNEVDDRKRCYTPMEFSNWLEDYPYRRLIHHVVKKLILPCMWPYFCCFVGDNVVHVSSLFSFELLNYSFLAFIIRHRHEEDLGVTDTIAAITASIFYKSDRLPWYTVLLITLAPYVARSSFVLWLKTFGRTPMMHWLEWKRFSVVGHSLIESKEDFPCF